MKELITDEEFDNFRDMGIISSAEHLYEILDQAKKFLPHTCNLRCNVPRTSEDGETVFVCKVKDNYWRSLSPLCHTIQPVDTPHTPEAIAIYNRLGMMDGKKVLEACLRAEFHVPVSSREDPKMSTTNPHLFCCFPSCQNIQYTTGHTISAYLVKYCAKLDDVARGLVKPPGRDSESAAKIVMEQLHKTKISSNKILAEKTKKRGVNYGRFITHTECISVLLGDDLVQSSVHFKHYSTCPREYRPALVKRTSQPSSIDLQDYVANLALVGQEVRIGQSFETTRLFSSDQMRVIYDERTSSLTSDAITQFSIRPPELKYVNSVRLYTRWFEKIPIVFREKKIDVIRQELRKRLCNDLNNCQWINGLNVQIVLRRGAIVEILEYARTCDPSLFGSDKLKGNMLALLAQLKKYYIQFDCNSDGAFDGNEMESRSTRQTTLDSSKLQYRKLSGRFLSPDKCTSLPVPWTTPVYPKNRGRFLIFILL